MNILIVKLSSLGDVVHAMPAVQDIRAALPDAQIDWVVERGFAPLVQRCGGVRRVVACELRRWSKSPLSARTRGEWRSFRNELQRESYDAVIDLQGLTKSALIARMAKVAPAGQRYALANQTEGSGYEAPTRWAADVALRIESRSHAVQRSRVLCALALGYGVPASMHFGLVSNIDRTAAAMNNVVSRCVALIHGTSRDDKLWPEAHWIALGRRLLGEGLQIGLPHGDDAERRRSERIADALGADAQSWPRLDLDALADRLAGCAGAIGVDSGLSHIAMALGLPLVQIYNFDTAWRTGPSDQSHQVSVFASPAPVVDAVWRAWQQVCAPR